MTFADLQRMKRVSDPQISPSGKWVMFSVTDVDLEKNTKNESSLGGANRWIGHGRFRCAWLWRERAAGHVLEGGRVGGKVFAGWKAGAVYLGRRRDVVADLSCVVE